MAKPKISKPQTRLAIVAGAKIFTFEPLTPEGELIMFCSFSNAHKFNTVYN
jgi:hypothetical protein